jgi:hypothetical protein
MQDMIFHIVYLPTKRILKWFFDFKRFDLTANMNANLFTEIYIFSILDISTNTEWNTKSIGWEYGQRTKNFMSAQLYILSATSNEPFRSLYSVNSLREHHFLDVHSVYYISEAFVKTILCGKASKGARECEYWMQVLIGSDEPFLSLYSVNLLRE